MKVFVTGGTGFIGSHVVSKLIDEGHNLLLLQLVGEVVKSYPQTVNVVKGDLSNINNWIEEVRAFNPDITIHMAWEGIPNYDEQTSNRNLKYGLDLIKTLGEIGCKRIIATGSCWEYGKKTGEISEDLEINPSNPFTIAKNTLREKGRGIAKENNMEFIWIRFFYVYGPGQKNHSLIPHIINSMQAGNKPEVKTPYSKNDFVYVEDVAEAISDILNRGKGGEIYNIGSGYSTEIKKIIELVYKHYMPDEKYIPTVEKPMGNDIVDFWADVSKIKNEIKWEAKTTIEEGVEKTINYFEEANRN